LLSFPCPYVVSTSRRRAGGAGRRTAPVDSPLQVLNSRLEMILHRRSGYRDDCVLPSMANRHHWHARWRRTIRGWDVSCRPLGASGRSYAQPYDPSTNSTPARTGPSPGNRGPRSSNVAHAPSPPVRPRSPRSMTGRQRQVLARATAQTTHSTTAYAGCRSSRSTRECWICVSGSPHFSRARRDKREVRQVHRCMR
jgi:hypothetical protein